MDSREKNEKEGKYKIVHNREKEKGEEIVMELWLKFELLLIGRSFSIQWMVALLPLCLVKNLPLMSSTSW